MSHVSRNAHVEEAGRASMNVLAYKIEPGDFIVTSNVHAVSVDNSEEFWTVLHFPEHYGSLRLPKATTVTVIREEAATADDVRKKVIDLWNQQGGWIPGAAYGELAEALGVAPSLLTYWDAETKRRVAPEKHRYFGYYEVAASRMGGCRIWVNGEQCRKTPEEHR